MHETSPLRASSALAIALMATALMATAAIRPAAAQDAAPLAPQGGLPAPTPLSTGFTYQGRLVESGVPAQGAYDMVFTLYNADGFIVAPQFPLAGIPCQNGLFTVDLDFGPAYTGLNGQRLELEVRVRRAGQPSFTTLSPRQAITAAPFAQGLRLPFEAVADVSGNVVRVRNPGDAGPDAAAIVGEHGAAVSPSFATAAGVKGMSADEYGVLGYSRTNVGVFGLAENGGTGVLGQGTGASSTGVYGITEFPAAVAVRGLASGIGGIGVEGIASFNAGVGVQGFASGPGRVALQGIGADGASAAFLEGRVLVDGNLDVSGRTITEDLYVTNGAFPGAVLTAQNAAGEAVWLAPTPAPDEIRSAVTVSSSGAAPSSTIQFLSPPATVTITAAGQRVLVWASRALGSNAAGGANGLAIYIGYRPSGGSIVTVPSGILGITVPQGTRIPMSLSQVLSLPPGTYEVGMVGSAVTPAAWNLNEFGYTTAVVID